MKTLFLSVTLTVLFYLVTTTPASAQLAVTRMIGKNAREVKTGFGFFAYYDFYLKEEHNRAIRLELLDFNYYPPKIKDVNKAYGFVSVKLGYKYVFSETGTGIYVLPQLGYTRVVEVDPALPEATYGDGAAAALEAGYCIELGERGNPLHFGLKYEASYGNKDHFVQSMAFKVSYSFFYRSRK